jgi:holo-[acyl-carrier protein] synthase
MTTLSIPTAAQLRLGTDVVWIPSVRASVQQFGARYLRRLFTAQELQYCQGQPSPAQSCSPDPTQAPLRYDSLAARFAAKEAVLKLLRPDAHTAIPWTAIEVTRGAQGAPGVQLIGAAKALAQALGIHAIVLSLSHDNDYAVATAIGFSTV